MRLSFHPCVPSQNESFMPDISSYIPERVKVRQDGGSDSVSNLLKQLIGWCTSWPDKKTKTNYMGGLPLQSAPW